MTRDAGVDPNRAKATLVAMRKELLELAESSRESRAPVELDQTSVGRLSRMDALQVQAMALETGRRRDNEIRMIEAALQRIEDGEYGYCVSCGEEIPLKRLELDPTTPVCVDCATPVRGGR
ncbi:MAG: TraR/DksA family transcriptional regulator [Hyphomicrobiales bacterium]|nr:TraR/DksA family transcriptional regulator [Hyphomicrobiales bacterium]MCP5372862.1 TraR/DksA family transcriptional regulator [Hyphomicrobiales bacterium]